MAFRRRKLNKKISRRVFKKGDKFDSRNIVRAPMRGGIRM